MLRRLRSIIGMGWCRLLTKRRTGDVASYSHPDEEVPRAGPDGVNVFEQLDRWLEELLEYTHRKESITCTSGHMPLTAILQEIADACADPQQHGHMQIYDWQSRASDLADTLDWLGPELKALVDAQGQAIQQAITTQLLYTNPKGKPALDDTKRPVVDAANSALITVIGDDMLMAAWRDLVTACRDIDHTRYPHDRVAFLRDNVVGLSEHRKQDRGHWDPISTAANVLVGYQSMVRTAQAMVGELPDETEPYDPRAKSTLTETELADLAERCAAVSPKTGDFVVWFRLAPAFVRSMSCVSHGDVTFYDAQMLASALAADEQRVRELFDVVPEELLTDEIRELQSSGQVDDHTGFEYEPQLVYARVEVRGIQRHNATAAARSYLDAVLAVVGVHDDMWKVLGGTLLFDGQPSYFPPVRWGLKEPLPDRAFHENDHFTTNLDEMTAAGHVITAEAVPLLQPVLRLQAALAAAPRSDPEAVILAAVRAIEHCNRWAAPHGGHKWFAFVADYFFDEYTVTSFANRVVRDVFAAVVQYVPDHSPGARMPAELATIREDITDASWGVRINRQKTLDHVAALKRIYADHWLSRQLNETDDTLSSGAALSGAFAIEQQRLERRVARLTRSRNAAVHGGPLSTAACDSIADFATVIAQKALYTAVRAIIAGQAVDVYAAAQRDKYRQRSQNLAAGGDLKNLFTLS